MNAVELIALRCESCHSPMQGEQGQILVGCRDCQKLFEVVRGELEPRPVVWYRTAPKYAAEAAEYAPFWLFETEVTVQRREATGGGVTGFFSKLFGSDDGTGVARFKVFVPSWDLPLKPFKELCVSLIKLEEERFQLGDSDRFPWPSQAAVVPLEEAEKALHFVYLTLEAEKPDVMVSIDFELEVHARQLALIPIKKLGDSLQILL